MKKLLFILLLLSTTCFGQSSRIVNGWRINQHNPANPTNLALQGYGVNATGASVSDPTITVSSTSAGTGIGTLYYAVYTAIGGTGSSTSHKKIVFSVSGTITSNNFTMDNLSYVTFDATGQTIVITAPANDGFSFESSGAHHIIVKNMHFANCAGDGANVVDNTITGAHDIAFMNCSFYGNGDGNIDVGVTTGTDANVTIQYCLIGNHIAPLDDGTGGSLCTSTNVTYHHNLFNVKSDEEGERCPLIHGNYSNAYADVRNNIVYNFGRSNSTGSGFGTACLYGIVGAGGYARANIVNNYYYTPSVSAASDGVWVNGDGGSIPAGEAYSAGNISGNGYNFNTGVYTNHAEWTVDPPYNITVETACDAVHNVLANVGPDTKNSTDNTLISQVTNIGTCILEMKKQIFLTLYGSEVVYNNQRENSQSNPLYHLKDQDVAIIDNRRGRLTDSKLKQII